MSTSHEPATIDLERDRALTIVWDDDVVSRFGLEELRVNCPCAECRGLREQGTEVWPKSTSPQPLRAEGAELVGAWGISLTWNDGHSTGIYAWDVLRAWTEGDG
ncbi:MAG: DUF971 domain-containing protein [Acidimicrobiia bacterium]|nr:DUF971 domain-containing protein [Acidimicrobiia bacterium]